MNFSAWCEVYLGGHWWILDARYTMRRRTHFDARARDATDVALSTASGPATLTHFEVVTEAVD